MYGRFHSRNLNATSSGQCRGSERRRQTSRRTIKVAALLKTGTDAWICVFDLRDGWCTNIPAVHCQKSWPVAECKTHSIFALSGMTRIQIEMSCRHRTLKDTHCLRPNLCPQTHRGFGVKVSPAVEAKTHSYMPRQQRLRHSALATERVQHVP
jgi:hypothetical protein